MHRNHTQYFAKYSHRTFYHSIILMTRHNVIRQGRLWVWDSPFFLPLFILEIFAPRKARFYVAQTPKLHRKWKWSDFSLRIPFSPVNSRSSRLPNSKNGESQKAMRSSNTLKSAVILPFLYELQASKCITIWLYIHFYKDFAFSPTNSVDFVIHLCYDDLNCVRLCKKA